MREREKGRDGRSNGACDGRHLADVVFHDEDPKRRDLPRHARTAGHFPASFLSCLIATT